MTGLYGGPFVYASPQKRFLSDTATLRVALKELSSGLTTERAKELPQRLKQLTKLYAFDLSSNFIKMAGW